MLSKFFIKNFEIACNLNQTSNKLKFDARLKLWDDVLRKVKNPISFDHEIFRNSINKKITSHF